MSVQELLTNLIQQIETLARSETIIGDPLTLGEHTVIPVTRVSVGFGAGSGEGEGSESGKASGKGVGGGGGGGVKLEPAAFIVVHGDQLSVMAAPGKKGALSEMFEHLPDVVAKIAAAQAGAGGKGKKGGAAPDAGASEPG